MIEVLIIASGWFFCGMRTATASDLVANPQLISTDKHPHLAAYAGSASCRECHSTEYDLWAKSHHSLAERPVQPEMDQSAFAPARTIKHVSQTSQTRIQNGKYEIVTLGFKTNVVPYQVERVIGVDPVRQFLSASTNGRWQVHELSYDPKASQWFDVYGTDDRQPGEWGHWTGRGMNWNSQCAACHNTHLQKNYDESTDSYHTTMAEMGVGCEACHGPLRAHVEWRKTHPGTKLKDSTVAPLSSVQTLDNCGSCHARADDLTGAFQPGNSLFDHYSLQILDSAQRWYPDGQVHDEDYEYASFLSSKMHESGVACIDCHNAHSMKLRLPGNDLCMRCHNGSFAKAPVINSADHGHHQLSSKGNECIGCHMPVTVYMQRHERHDHGLTIPDPLLTKQLGIPNACNRCHTDHSPDWAREKVDQWYGNKMQRHTRERAQWIAAAQAGEDNGKEKLLGMLTSKTESPYWRSVAAGMLWRWVNDSQAKSALLIGLKDPHPLIREQAIRSLAENNTSEIIAALKPLLNDPARNVRIAAAWALRETLDLQSQADSQLQSARSLDADQPRGQFRIAMLQLAQGRQADALTHLQKAAAWDPFSPPLQYELAKLLAQMGRTAEARAAASQTLKLQPDFKPAKDLLHALQDVQ
jgi:HEAT repeats/Tetratricopeptide repeat/Cytochrome c552/Cytochrome c554 and c-prime